MGQLLAIGLAIAGVGWLIKWALSKVREGVEAAEQAVVEHQSLVLAIGGGILFIVVMAAIGNAAAKRQKEIESAEAQELSPALDQRGGLKLVEAAEEISGQQDAGAKAYEKEVSVLESAFQEIEARAKRVMKELPQEVRNG